MNQPIGVAVIGLGDSGRYLHCRPLSRLPELYRIKGVFDAVPATRETVAGVYGVRAYASLDELLDDEGVSLVVVATPTPYHKELAVAAARAGKNVVVEKPMAMNTDEAKAMIAEAVRNDVLLTIHKNRRWYAEFRTVRRILEEGLLGKVFDIERRSAAIHRPGTTWTNWRGRKAMGGGILNEMGSHLVDQILLLVPSSVQQVTCSMRSIFTAEVDDFFRLSLSFADGTLALIECYLTTYLPQAMWYIMGEQGTLTSEQDNNWGKMTVVREVDGLRLTMYPDPLEGGIEEAGCFFYTALARSIRDGEELAVKPQEVLRVIQVLDAARQSAETEETVHAEI